MGFRFISLSALTCALMASAPFTLRPTESATRTLSVESTAPSAASSFANTPGHQLHSITSRPQPKKARLVTWKGSQDNRWSNPRNWEGGRVPGAADVARFAGSSNSQALLDADSPATVAGLVLEPDYRGTLSLKRDLTVSAELVLAGGVINQGDCRLSVSHYRQTGGTFTGGNASLNIQDEANVSGGRLLTSKSITVPSLTIDSPGVVTMAANSKLNLTGDGEPLNGSGRLDVKTNAPNSIEYTGPATADVLRATPIKGALGTAGTERTQIASQLRGLASQESSAALTGFSRTGALTLTAKEEMPFAAASDTVNGFAYFGTLTSPGIVVKVRLSDFSRVGALVLNNGENDLRSAVIDSANGFAYFGALTGTVVKVQLSDFTRVAAFDAGGPVPRHSRESTARRPNANADSLAISRTKHSSISASTASANEAANATTKVDLTVTRTGDTAQAATVNYATSDATANQRSDYQATLGTLHFAANEPSKTIPIFIVNDAFGEAAETFNVTLSGPVGCTLGAQAAMVITINSDEAANGPNPVRDASFNSDFFVRQHYPDFLNREPDASGLAFWKD